MSRNKLLTVMAVQKMQTERSWDYGRKNVTEMTNMYFMQRSMLNMDEIPGTRKGPILVKPHSHALQD